MYNIVYVEMTVTCIFILLILLYKVRVVLGFSRERKLFSMVLKLAIISTGLEGFTYVVDHATFYMADTVNAFVCAAYFVSMVVMGFYWFCFISRLLNIDILASRKSIILLSIPAVVSAVLSVVSIWTGGVFYIEPDNSYVRGDFYTFYVVCNCFYTIFASYMCLQRVFMKQYYLDREMNLALVSFAVFPMAAVLIQILWDDLTMSSPGVVLGLLLCFIMMLAGRITADPLTGLNNKSQLHRFLLNRIPNIPRETQMYLFVLDVVNLKAINRECGFQEGDKALITVSNVLKQVCGPQGCFINRNDGGSFNLAAVLNNDGEAENIVRMVADALAEKNKKLFYDLKLRIVYSSETLKERIPDLFVNANANLKAEKQKSEK